MRSNQLAVLTIPALCLGFCLIQLVSALLPDRKVARFRDSSFGSSPSNSYIDHHFRRKRYVLRTKRWRKKDFTWKLLPNNLKEGDDYIVRQEFQSIDLLGFHRIGRAFDLRFVKSRLEHWWFSDFHIAETHCIEPSTCGLQHRLSHSRKHSVPQNGPTSWLHSSGADTMTNSPSMAETESWLMPSIRWMEGYISTPMSPGRWIRDRASICFKWEI